MKLKSDWHVWKNTVSWGFVIRRGILQVQM